MWWVIEDEELRDALRRAHEGEDPMTVEAELYANTRPWCVGGEDEQ